MYLEQKIKEILTVTSLITLIGCATTKPTTEYDPIRQKLPKHVPEEMTRNITEYTYDSCGTQKTIIKQFDRYYIITDSAGKTRIKYHSNPDK